MVNKESTTTVLLFLMSICMFQSTRDSWHVMISWHVVSSSDVSIFNMIGICAIAMFIQPSKLCRHWCVWDSCWSPAEQLEALAARQAAQCIPVTTQYKVFLWWQGRNGPWWRHSSQWCILSHFSVCINGCNQVIATCDSQWYHNSSSFSDSEKLALLSLRTLFEATKVHTSSSDTWNMSY